MGNSIEEDIEIIESIIEEYENCSVPEVDMQVNVTFREKQNNALNHILSDYKRVLEINEVLLKENERLQKENEELKQDRNNNYQMIALAQNEVLGYMQGYEDGKKLNRSAVACVVENQQYYIIKKEIEHYKENIEKLQKENELAKKQVEYDKTHIFTPQTIKLNYIPIQKVKDKIRHYQELQDNYIKKYDEINEGLQAMINVLQELLEGRK